MSVKDTLLAVSGLLGGNSGGGGGGEVVLVNKTVSANGTYLPSADSADGYKKVVVNVPTPTLVTKTVTENGTYAASEDSADGYSSVTVDVPESGVKGQYSSRGHFLPTEIVYPATVTNLTVSYYNIGGANNVVSISGLAKTTTSAPANQFREMSNLKTVNLPYACHVYGMAFGNCYELESVELGSVGYPVVVTRNTTFQGDTQAFTITMYVNASTLAEAMAIADVGTLAPWGATHATIVFKSSTTGEVLV